MGVSAVCHPCCYVPRCVFAKSKIWENNLHPGRLTAGSPTNHQFFRKEHDLPEFPWIMFQPFIWLRGVIQAESLSISTEPWSSTSIGFIGFFHIYLHAKKKGSILPDPKLGEFVACKILDDSTKWCMTPPNLQAKTPKISKLEVMKVVKSPGFLATNLKII